jgi:hypothetical protein
MLTDTISSSIAIYTSKSSVIPAGIAGMTTCVDTYALQGIKSYYLQGIKSYYLYELTTM